MKNMADGNFYEIDDGAVNMEAVATVARNAADVDYLIYEYDAAPQPMASMKIGAGWLERINSRPITAASATLTPMPIPHCCRSTDSTGYLRFQRSIDVKIKRPFLLLKMTSRLHRLSVSNRTV